MAPRETENNAYAKFWSDQQRVLWYVMAFSVLIGRYLDLRVYVTFSRVHGPMGSTPGWNSQLLVSSSLHTYHSISVLFDAT